ncbi:MAG TPA: hypothetical protein VMS92_21440 [Mycobacterium sp.]|nr:hypothetical protein [Mycobacterium sp.]
MIRALVLAACTVALFGGPAIATADPAEQGDAVFAIGKCYDPSQPPAEQPGSFAYNCDTTGVMHDMTWSSWGPDGAHGTGTDSAVECQPSCAEGARLVNPIVVHAWNPSPTSPACPQGLQFYSDMTIAYPEGVPPWIEPGATWSPGTDFVTVDGMPAVHYSELTPTCAPL